MNNLVVIAEEDLIALLRSVVREELSQHSPSPSANTVAEYLSQKEALELLGITLPTLLKHTKTGKVIGHRIGRRMRYKRSDIESAMKQIKVCR